MSSKKAGFSRGSRVIERDEVEVQSDRVNFDYGAFVITSEASGAVLAGIQNGIGAGLSDADRAPRGTSPPTAATELGTSADGSFSSESLRDSPVRKKFSNFVAGRASRKSSRVREEEAKSGRDTDETDGRWRDLSLSGGFGPDLHPPDLSLGLSDLGSVDESDDLLESLSYMRSPRVFMELVTSPMRTRSLSSGSTSGATNITAPSPAVSVSPRSQSPGSSSFRLGRGVFASTRKHQSDSDLLGQASPPSRSGCARARSGSGNVYQSLAFRSASGAQTREGRVIVRAAFLAPARLMDSTLRGRCLSMPETEPLYARDGGVLRMLSGPHPYGTSTMRLGDNDAVAARSISTYPKVGRGEQRNGDPVADATAAQISAGRLVLAVADGCGWGMAAALAARVAVASFVRNVVDIEDRVAAESGTLLVDDLTHIILDAFFCAHAEVCIPGPVSGGVCGTTTLGGGVLTTLDSGEFIFVHASVGDVRMFRATRVDDDDAGWEVESLTGGTTATKLVGREGRVDDCGGRIGPYTDGKADLRNLTVGATICQPGDLLFAMSDGVDDNLDPQRLGLRVGETAKRVGLLDEVPTAMYDGSQGGVSLEAEWNSLDPSVAGKLKDHYRSDLLASCLAKGSSPPQVVSTLLQHAAAVTTASRTFMETSGAALPDDYVRFPGKMDHATVVVTRVPDSPVGLTSGVVASGDDANCDPSVDALGANDSPLSWKS
uniref:PPM-type phosphatase domain-containing protein n=1 Tax=Sexangularia sp. CB-2014 TaxID=1486929 RepID=A0A7S1VQY1_9EUKA